METLMIIMEITSLIATFFCFKCFTLADTKALKIVPNPMQYKHGNAMQAASNPCKLGMLTMINCPMVASLRYRYSPCTKVGIIDNARMTQPNAIRYKNMGGDAITMCPSLLYVKDKKNNDKKPCITTNTIPKYFHVPELKQLDANIQSRWNQVGIG